jgi:hypothetical protein
MCFGFMKIRRPDATTVSAARMKASAMSLSLAIWSRAASAFARASRDASAGHFAETRLLVDRRRPQGVGLYADLCQQH